MDGFADLDTIEVSSSSWCLPLDSGAFVQNQLDACLSRLKSCRQTAGVLLGAGAEHLAQWIEQETEWTIFGNSSSTIQAINQPKSFFQGLTQLGVKYPEVLFDSSPNPDPTGWIFKLADSCGGVGITREPLAAFDGTGYWQRELSGQPISALYITDGEHHHCIGLNTLSVLAIDENHPYVYLGANSNTKLNNYLLIEIDKYARKIIDHFNLIGIFSLDMVISQTSMETSEDAQQEVYVLEVNPRISASYELYERINANLNLVDEHIRVCEGVADPIFTRIDAALPSSVSSYRVVYAGKDTVIAAHDCWPEWCQDLPEAGRSIKCGEPICSIYADADQGDINLLLEEREKIIINKIK